MEVSEFLKNAKALINTPDKWTKRAYARDAGGNSVSEDSPDAVCFCSVGALDKLVRAEPSTDVKVYQIRNIAHSILDAAAKELDGEGSNAMGLNDSAVSHSEVMAMFDLAIAKAGGK